MKEDCSMVIPEIATEVQIPKTPNETVDHISIPMESTLAKPSTSTTTISFATPGSTMDMINSRYSNPMDYD